MQIRVPYADTDQMGMVYYANYLVYFERGRTEWLREHGLTYRDLEEKGFYFPVIECSVKYNASARYDDMITVRTVLSDIGSASVEFTYEIVRDDKQLATGKTRHPLVNKGFRPVRIPADIRTVLEKARG
jgi:acyl-CoA thioester hydrolase